MGAELKKCVCVYLACTHTPVLCLIVCRYTCSLLALMNTHRGTVSSLSSVAKLVLEGRHSGDKRLLFPFSLKLFPLGRFHNSRS